jgi:hypothetical protein
MPTEDQMMSSKRGAGDGKPAMVRVTKKVTFTIAANATYSDSVDMPPGSTFVGIQGETPTAVAGTPTTCNFRAGTAAAGQQVVADVDLKGQGHVACTIVATFDKVGNAATAKQTIFLQLVCVGGTGPSGTVYALVTYDAPVF